LGYEPNELPTAPPRDIFLFKISRPLLIVTFISILTTNELLPIYRDSTPEEAALLRAGPRYLYRYLTPLTQILSNSPLLLLFLLHSIGSIALALSL
jgi:hypothetical protein